MGKELTESRDARHANRAIVLAPNAPAPDIASEKQNWLVDLAAVLAAALALRLVFAFLIGDTYDYDEFVLLALSRAMSHGAVPYRDFMFFHPPGVLVVLRVLAPLTDRWWPAARLFILLVDAATAGLVWRLALAIWGSRREALAAGALYAISPLALVSASRVDQDSLITFLGVLGLVLLVPSQSAVRAFSVVEAFLAGICLGLAFWIKYPAALFIPVYLIAAPRRTVVWGPAALVTVVVAFLPFLGSWHGLYFDTVTFQRTRWLMPLSQRLDTALLYWLAVNALALPALFLRRPPAWALLGFALGGVFAFDSQVYYHYFAPIVPFGALIAAPLAARLRVLGRSALTAGAPALTLGWSYLVGHGGPSPLFVTAAHLSAIDPTVRLIEQRTSPGSAVLADRFEYAYLSNRRPLANYFWNVGVLVDARYLERRVSGASAVVLSYGASSGFPSGFTAYLDHRYPSVDTPANTVWWITKHP